jgi:hypothetical protein
MRKATDDERKRYRSLTRDDLSYIVSESRIDRMPVDAKWFLPQVEWCSENVVIRGINRDTLELLIDCGFGRVFWVGADDPSQPLLQWIAYEPSDVERQQMHERLVNGERMRNV